MSFNIIDYFCVFTLISFVVLGGLRGLLHQLKHLLPLLLSLAIFLMVPFFIEKLHWSWLKNFSPALLSLFIALGCYPFWIFFLPTIKMGLSATPLIFFDKILGALMGMAQGVVYLTAFIAVLSLTPLAADPYVKKSYCIQFVLSYLHQIPFQYFWKTVKDPSSWTKSMSLFF